MQNSGEVIAGQEAYSTSEGGGPVRYQDFFATYESRVEQELTL